MNPQISDLLRPGKSEVLGSLVRAEAILATGGHAHDLQKGLSTFPNALATICSGPILWHFNLRREIHVKDRRGGRGNCFSVVPVGPLFAELP